MERFDSNKSFAVRWLAEQGLSGIIKTIMHGTNIKSLSLHGAKLYLMDDGRWLIMDYLNIPDAPRHYIDCMEGSVCNMNVRIISESTKAEIEKNQEIFNELT